MSIKIDDESVTIYYEEKELVKWLDEEWIEDPDVVFSILFYVCLAYEDPKKLYEFLKVD